jgi:hypothetical protein
VLRTLERWIFFSDSPGLAAVASSIPTSSLEDNERPSVLGSDTVFTRCTTYAEREILRTVL